MLLDQQVPYKKNWTNMESVESKARNIIKQAIDIWDQDELWDNISRTQILVDNFIDFFARELKFDLTNEKQEVLDDGGVVSDSEWQAYYLYLEYLYDYFKRVTHLIEQAKKVIQNNYKSYFGSRKKNCKLQNFLISS